MLLHPAIIGSLGWWPRCCILERFTNLSTQILSNILQHSISHFTRVMNTAAKNVNISPPTQPPVWMLVDEGAGGNYLESGFWIQFSSDSDASMLHLLLNPLAFWFQLCSCISYPRCSMGLEYLPTLSFSLYGFSWIRKYSVVVTIPRWFPFFKNRPDSHLSRRWNVVKLRKKIQGVKVICNKLWSLNAKNSILILCCLDLVNTTSWES